MILKFIKARLKEPSTWRGMVGLVTALGITLNPDQVEAIVAGGLALMGLIAAFTADATPERNVKKALHKPDERPGDMQAGINKLMDKTPRP